MAEMDPHGLNLALISILFVFAVLFVLYLIYSISGMTFVKRQKKAERSTKETSIDEEKAAAIAAALAQYEQDFAHDEESGIITITRKSHSNWTRV